MDLHALDHADVSTLLARGDGPVALGFLLDRVLGPPLGGPLPRAAPQLLRAFWRRLRQGPRLDGQNALNRATRERGFEACVAGLAAGRQMLAAQTYEVTNEIEARTALVVEGRWTGTMAAAALGLPAGARLTADLCMIFTFAEDGRLLRQVNYDCYDPLPLPG